ncbi:MAG: hypothetical protein JO116_08610 [Planctomycetaceae bacterium]|nr:hypothetical protein [Planctomycetaceae bacterium]
MDSLARAKPRWHAFGRWAALVATCVAAGGCLGPQAVSHTRIRYNEVFRSTNDQQLLLNIVRLRYADSPVFIDLPNITSQFEASGLGNYNGGYGYQFRGPTSLGFGQLSLRDTPTLSYHPREGKEIARALLTPLSAELLQVLRTGTTLEQFYLMAVKEINDVPNASLSTQLTPVAPDDNITFRYCVQLLKALRQRGAVELGIGTTEESDASSDPIPTQQVEGRDVLNAAKDSYVFRIAPGSNRATLLKRERGLVLRVRPEFHYSPEGQELARLLRLTPGLAKYKMKSEQALEAEEDEMRTIRDTIYLNMRSVLEIAIFLSKGVCVPEEHVRHGIVPTTPGPDGRPYDWSQVTAGLFCVRAQRHRPCNAEVAVKYRGYWFYIAPDDVNSRAVLTIFEVLFSLQESDGKQLGPLLTLPLGG